MGCVVPPGKPIKLVVWELARLAGGEALAGTLVRTLDERGILQSLVGADAAAFADLKLTYPDRAYFLLEPRLGAAPITSSVQEIADTLNIRLDGTLLISDTVTAQAHDAHSQLRVVGSWALADLATDPLMGQSLVGIEPRPRRLLYLEEQLRKRSEQNFDGSRREFLAALEMRVSIEPARPAQLRRLQELINRPNQLGRNYSEQELEALLSSPEHACWLVSVQDHFGDCGQVGVVLLRLGAECWTLQLLLFSCRVAARDVDGLVLHSLVRKAHEAGVALHALFKHSSRNQALWLTYQQAGFEATGRQGEILELTQRLDWIAPDPCPARVVFNGV